MMTELTYTASVSYRTGMKDYRRFADGANLGGIVFLKEDHGI